MVLVGHSMGVQMALEAHRRHPERVAGLILICGAPGRPLDAVHDVPLAAAALPYAQAAVSRFPGLSRLLFRSVLPTELSLKMALTFEVNERLVAREDLVRYLDDLADVDPALFLKLLGSAAHDRRLRPPPQHLRADPDHRRRAGHLHAHVALGEDARRHPRQRAAGADRTAATSGRSSTPSSAACGSRSTSTTTSAGRTATAASRPVSLPAALAPLLALLAASPRQASAQPYDPDYRWQTIDTPHFQVHFHQGLEALAQRAAREAERAHARLAPLLGYSPRQRTQLVVSDDSDSANGSATPIPYDTIRIYAVPPESGSVLNDERDWLEAVITHEYVHILHLDHVGGFPALVNGLFGKIWPPNALTPGWMIEGLAVSHEAPAGSGAGRNDSALFDMYQRAMVVEPPGFPTLAMASNPYLEWPRGNVSYLLGGRFMAWIERRSGPEAMRGFLADQGSAIWPWAPSWAAGRWFGADLPTLWDQFAAGLQQGYAAQLTEVRRRPVTRPVPLTARGGTIERPRWLPDGAGLAYVDRGLDERAGLRRVARDGTDLGRALVVDMDGTFALRSAGEAVVAKGQVWREFRLYTDLYLADLGRGTDRRLTDGERATDPALGPGGASVVYVAQAGAGEQALRRRGLDGGPVETLLQLPGVQLYEPAVSPDGTRIALSVQRDGRRDLVLLEDGRLRDVTSDDALDRSPSWSPDGRWLLFCSDRGGIYNLYAWEAATGLLRQVTNVESGALDPVVSPDGATLAFVTYSRRGYDLATIPFDPATWLDPAPAAPAVAAPVPAPGAEAAARPYSAAETVQPFFWLPTFSINQDGGTYGAYTMGTDVLGRHTWQLDAYADTAHLTLGYSFSYVGGWSWPSLDLYSTRYVTDSPGYPDRPVSAWTPLAPGASLHLHPAGAAARLPRRLDPDADRVGRARCRPTSATRPGGSSPTASSPRWRSRRPTATPTATPTPSPPRRGAPWRCGSATPATPRQRLPALAGAAGLERVHPRPVHPPRGAGDAPLGRHRPRLARRLAPLLAGRPPLHRPAGAHPAPVLLAFGPAARLRGRAVRRQRDLLGHPRAALPALHAGGRPIHLADLPAPRPRRPLRRLRRGLRAGDREGLLRTRLPLGAAADGAGGELRLETALAYWLLTDIRLGVARGLGKPLGGLSPTQDPYAIWQWYVTLGPSF